MSHKFATPSPTKMATETVVYSATNSMLKYHCLHVYRNVALGSGTAVARIRAFSAPFIAQAVRIELVTSAYLVNSEYQSVNV